MRIQVLSDLHLEYGGEIPPLAPGAEVVVLAGDLAPAKHRAIRLPGRDPGRARRISSMSPATTSSTAPISRRPGACSRSTAPTAA